MGCGSDFAPLGFGMLRNRGTAISIGGLLGALASACGSETDFNDGSGGNGTGGPSGSGGTTSGAGGTGEGGGGSGAGGSSGAATGGNPSGGNAGSAGSATGGDATGSAATGGAATGGAGASGAGAGGAATGGAGAGGAGAGGAGAGGAGAGAGGAGSGGAATNPAPGMYGTRAMLPAANSEMAVAEANGKIYILGGYPSSGESVTTVSVYDVATNMWSAGPALPEPLHHPVAIGVSGKIYSLGGQIGRNASVDTTLTIVLDPAAAQPGWTTLAAMPTARGAGAAAAIGDQIYVVGGRPPAGNAFERYDISDNMWMPLPDLPTAANDRNHIAATAIGGKVYVAGGRYNGGSFSSPMTDRLDIYDPGTNMWTPGAPLLRPRGGLNGVAAFGCFYTWGGEGGNIGEPNNVFPDHDVYNPRTNMWTALADLPTPIHGVTGAAFVNGLIYMPGGGTQQGGSSGSTIFQVYRPAMNCE
jgi:N-acetylneuraminic acid mutarotase